VCQLAFQPGVKGDLKSLDISVRERILGNIGYGLSVLVKSGTNHSLSVLGIRLSQGRGVLYIHPGH
jgi:hypothetical protein